jgi:hypothetical protein
MVHNIHSTIVIKLYAPKNSSKKLPAQFLTAVDSP